MGKGPANVVLIRPLFLPGEGCLLALSSHGLSLVHVCIDVGIDIDTDVDILIFILRYTMYTLMLLDQGSPLVTSFNFNYFLKGLISSHPGG